LAINFEAQSECANTSCNVAKHLENSMVIVHVVYYNSIDTLMFNVKI